MHAHDDIDDILADDVNNKYQQYHNRHRQWTANQPGSPKSICVYFIYISHQATTTGKTTIITLIFSHFLYLSLISLACCSTKRISVVNICIAAVVREEGCEEWNRDLNKEQMSIFSRRRRRRLLMLLIYGFACVLRSVYCSIGDETSGGL